MKTLTLFVLISAIAGSSARTTESLINAYVPVLAGEAVDVEIRELTFLTWGALSMIGLRISPTIYPVSSCIVRIDTAEMTEFPEPLAQAHRPHNKKEMLMHVLEATRRNLHASQIDGCRLSVEGAELHDELTGVAFPERLNGR